MNDIENELRRALRPLEPSAGFTDRLLAALPPRQAPTVIEVRTPHASPPASRWQRFAAPTALAASVVLAIIGGQRIALERFEREERAGLAASQALMQALRVTSRKLDLARDAVRTPEPSTETADGETRS